MIVAGIVSALGFLYYLIFGARQLSPSVHHNLSKERLVRLLGESFSYGEDGAQFSVCVGDGGLCVTLTKEIRATDDVHLVYRDSTNPDKHPLREQDTVRAPRFVDFGEDVDQAVQFVTHYLSENVGRALEDGCYYQATGVSIYRRHGWST
jgi:hypothetical protein